MNFSDIGIVISLKAYGEGAAIIKILTKNHGLHKFITPRTLTNLKDYRSSFSVGNLIDINWYTKNDDGFGVITDYYLQNTYLAKILFFQIRLNYFKSLIKLIELNFPEKQECGVFFDKLGSFMTILADSTLGEERILTEYKNFCYENFDHN